MDRIRSRGTAPAFATVTVEWPPEGIVLPDGCLPLREQTSAIPQIVLEHSDDDGATWSVVGDAGGGAGTSPTSGPVPSSEPVTPDYVGAARRGIMVQIPKPQAPPPPPEPNAVTVPTPSARTSIGEEAGGSNEAVPQRGKKKWR